MAQMKNQTDARGKTADDVARDGGAMRSGDDVQVLGSALSDKQKDNLSSLGQEASQQGELYEDPTVDFAEREKGLKQRREKIDIASKWLRRNRGARNDLYAIGKNIWLDYGGQEYEESTAGRYFDAFMKIAEKAVSVSIHNQATYLRADRRQLEREAFGLGDKGSIRGFGAPERETTRDARMAQQAQEQDKQKNKESERTRDDGRQSTEGVEVTGPALQKNREDGQSATAQNHGAQKQGKEGAVSTAAQANTQNAAEPQRGAQQSQQASQAQQVQAAKNEIQNKAAAKGVGLSAEQVQKILEIKKQQDAKWGRGMEGPKG